ncbi:uncharacterized protein RCO7_03250 [Rhynchosporium graminicola]|uniref:2EXR domain-containing protein n=1 Tax=Rhynchosporium graminicola TaxID=2792576 RepID=A0A1E1LK22_9HELO|nr:uncharacterized protein RCO7_03250 [Rhynchosporium commune]
MSAIGFSPNMPLEDASILPVEHWCPVEDKWMYGIQPRYRYLDMDEPSYRVTAAEATSTVTDSTISRSNTMDSTMTNTTIAGSTTKDSEMTDTTITESRITGSVIIDFPKTKLHTCVFFTVFAELSKEIQLMIWNSAADLPRAVVIDYKEGHLYRLQNPSKVPAILHACADSRSVGLTYFDLSFKHEISGFPSYINWKVDTLVFPRAFTLFTLFANVKEEERFNFVIPLHSSAKKVPLEEKVKLMVLAVSDVFHLMTTKRLILGCKNLVSVKFYAALSGYHNQDQEMDWAISCVTRDLTQARKDKPMLDVKRITEQEFQRFMTIETV